MATRPFSLSAGVVRQKFSFESFDWIMGLAGYVYYQILHTGSDHWVTTIKAVSDNELDVHDGILLQHTYHVLKQIASIVHTSLSQMRK